MSTSRKATDYLAQSAATGTPARPHLLHGVGVLGDSFYDEYQGSDNRGGDYHSVSFNLVELLVLNRDFNLGPWGKWGDRKSTRLNSSH